MKVFISYSRIDAAETAKIIHEYLTKYGNNDVFIDTSNISYGGNWKKVIQKEISDCDIFIIIVTPSALYRFEVEKEVELAKKLKKKIIPCIAKDYVEEDEIKWELNNYQGFFYDRDSKLAMELYIMIKREAKTRKTSTEVKTEIKTDESSAILEKQISIDTDSTQSFLDKAKGLEEIGQYSKALKAYDEALKINPNNFEACYNKGLIQEKMGDFENALDVFDKATDIDWKHKDVWYHLGRVLEKLERYEEALDALNTDLRIDPNDITTRKFKSQILEKLGKDEEYLQELDEIIKIDSKDLETLEKKAILLDKLLRHDEEIEGYDKVLEIQPNNKKYLDIFLRNTKELKELNQEYNKNHISFYEFHDKLIDFLIDVIDNTVYKEIFGYQNIELLNRQLANVTTLLSRLEEYKAIGNDEKEDELKKELSIHESEILGRLEKCNDYYNSKFLISEKSTLITEITTTSSTTTTIPKEFVSLGASNNQDAAQNAAYLKRNKTDDQKANLNKLCFVDMSFGQKKDPYTGIEVDFDQIYEKAIKPAIIDANLEPLRGDEEKRGGIIHQAMFARLLLSEYVIADLTTANANVYYELGIRHAARPFTTILLHGNLHPLPFDIAPNRTFMYNIEKDGTISDKSCLQLQEGIRARLDTIINNGASRDSPLFELIRNYKQIDLPRELKDNFQDRLKLEKNFNDQLDRAKSHNNATEKLRALREIRASLGNIKDKNDNILTNLLFAFRSVSAWEDMIQLCESFSYDLRNSYMIQQQEAFALNRRNSPNDREKAIQILNEVSLISGIDPETMGLLGRIYKDMYKESKKNNDNDAALGYLDKALETYKKGFYSDPRDYYPGINAVTLLIEKGDKQSYNNAKELITSVNLALARRGGLDSQNYWDLATILEIACIENDSELIDRLLPKIAIYAKETFMPETTGDNIKMLRDSLPRHYEKEKQESLISNLDRVILFLDMYHKKLING